MTSPREVKAHTCTRLVSFLPGRSIAPVPPPQLQIARRRYHPGARGGWAHRYRRKRVSARLTPANGFVHDHLKKNIYIEQAKKKKSMRNNEEGLLVWGYDENSSCGSLVFLHSFAVLGWVFFTLFVHPMKNKINKIKGGIGQKRVCTR